MLLKRSFRKDEIMKRNMLKLFRKLEEKHGNKIWWQFIKFNLVSQSTFFVQMILALILPLFFDSFKQPLPEFLRGIFDATILFPNESPYVVDGAVTWGYVLPLFLSNFLGNLYGYFMNMRFTFKGRFSKRSMALYLAVMLSLILISTWLQGRIISMLRETIPMSFSRILANSAAGLFQYMIIFPLEKFVLFREKEERRA